MTRERWRVFFMVPSHLLIRCSAWLISLPEDLGFHPDNMRILTDDQRNNQPTKANIVSIRADCSVHHLIYIVQLAGVRWLVEGAQPGDSLFFYCKRDTSHMPIVPTSALI